MVHRIGARSEKKVVKTLLEDQEISVLSLDLLQIALVYVNTLMIQNVLTDRTWMGRMAEEEFRALTPLIHTHVTPYGSFELDLEKRLPLEEPAVLVALFIGKMFAPAAAEAAIDARSTSS